jgi:glycosyltransferase involved in cell wall biosynthesis
VKVLVVHNRYSSRVPSGENLAVDDEVRWLRQAGLDVHVHEATNDDIFDAGTGDRARQALWALWSRPAQRRFASMLTEIGPDLVHVHNLFPLLTSSVPWAAVRRRIPVVWTVHNRQLLCARGTNFRDGRPCHLCRPGWRLAGIRYGCYQGPAATALVTGSTAVFRAMARRHITAVAISHNVRDWLVDAAGLPEARVHVKYNGVAAPDRPSQPAAANRTFLFAGQLIEYKGLELLLDAWRRAGPIEAELHIVGDGAQAPLAAAAASADASVKWLGQVPLAEMPALFAAARTVVAPSTLPETFGRVAAEALAWGRPVITSGLGGLGEIVDHESGWVTGSDVDALAHALVEASSSDEAVERRSEAARLRHQRLFSPEASTRRLREVYADCLASTIDESGTAHVASPGETRW